MKHLSKAIALCALSALMFSSCSETNPWDTGDGTKGAIHLSLESDGSVLRSTRADDTKASILPSPVEFGITLSRTDGSSSQKWDNLDQFNKETSFPIGEYKLEAKFGDLQTEGFTNPYYYASQVVSVTAGDEKTVNLRATLANCMVSIRYTDEFDAIYPQHSAAVRSTGHDYVVFTGDETRPAYMYPSAMSLSLTMTNSAGKQVTIQPAGFTAQARRHYVVTIGVTGTQDQGNLQLDVQFEENVVAETVNVSLGDELFEAEPPTITARDFTPGEALQSFENLTVSTDPRFEIYAFGGLREVNLSLINSKYNSPFGNEVQLVNASSLDQSNVAASGIEAYGLYRSPDKMGIVKLKGLLEKLPIGTHTLQLEVVDAMTRRSEPMTFIAEVSAVAITIRPAEEINYMTKDVVVYVSTNCPDIRNKSSFTVSQDDYDSEVVSVETLSGAPLQDIPATYTYHYKYTLKAAKNLVRNNLPVKLYYGNKADARAMANFPMKFPEFKLEVDPMATLTKFHVVAADSKISEMICDNLIIMKDGKRVDVEDFIPMEDENGEDVMELLGLEPGTTYSNIEYCLSYTTNPRTPIPAFTTETAALVPNGNFSATTQTLNFSNIQVGGGFRVSPTNYDITSSIVRDEANGWASLNQLTCYGGSLNKNTWFMVPSTFVENGAVTIRTVGYNHNGTTPARTGGSGNTTYYCENAPAANQLNISRGELFLGSYTYNGTPSRNDSINFSSRPLSVSFKYKYTPILIKEENGKSEYEVAEMELKVYDADGKILNEATEELEACSQLLTKSINIYGYPFGRKPAKLKICFRSTTSKNKSPKIDIPTGSRLDEGLKWTNFTNSNARHLSANSYHAVAIGSVLEVKDVTLGYKFITPDKRSNKRVKK